MDPAADEYIQQRLEQYRTWYDRRAVSCKWRYLAMRSATLLLAGSVTVLANVREFSFAGPSITMAGALVVVLLALENLFRYQEQWKNYRCTEQFLGHERFRFETGIGVYDGVSGHDAFLLLAARVEAAIAAENATTLHIPPDLRNSRTE